MDVPPVLPPDPVPAGGPGQPTDPPRPIAGPVRGGRFRGIAPWVAPAAVVGLGALALLWHFEPRGQFFFPRCTFLQVTGLQCPGCGGLRATHALLHGDVASAWRLNALWVAALPLGAWSAAALALERWTGRRIPHPLGWRRAWIPVVVAILAFGVLRNL